MAGYCSTYNDLEKGRWASLKQLGGFQSVSSTHGYCLVSRNKGFRARISSFSLTSIPRLVSYEAYNEHISSIRRMRRLGEANPSSRSFANIETPTPRARSWHVAWEMSGFLLVVNIESFNPLYPSSPGSRITFLRSRLRRSWRCQRGRRSPARIWGFFTTKACLTHAHMEAGLQTGMDFANVDTEVGENEEAGHADVWGFGDGRKWSTGG